MPHPFRSSVRLRIWLISQGASAGPEAVKSLLATVATIRPDSFSQGDPPGVELAAPLTKAALRGSWPSAAAGVIDARQVDMRSSRMGPRLAWREA